MWSNFVADVSSHTTTASCFWLPSLIWTSGANEWVTLWVKRKNMYVARGKRGEQNVVRYSESRLSGDESYSDSELSPLSSRVLPSSLFLSLSLDSYVSSNFLFHLHISTLNREFSNTKKMIKDVLDDRKKRKSEETLLTLPTSLLYRNSLSHSHCSSNLSYGWVSDTTQQ